MDNCKKLQERLAKSRRCGRNQRQGAATRVGNEGEEGARRGCAQCNEGSGRGRHHSGGGVAFIRAVEKLNTLKLQAAVRRADREEGGSKSRCVFIALNAGHDGSIVIERVKNGKGENFGFDAAKEVYVDDMQEAGISIRPRLPDAALQNAASVASLLLTTEAMIAEKPKENSAPMPPGGGYGRHGRNALAARL